ncbi:bifunctional 2-polyprenyl-6-hydroxyphenol methylase/3-demethylubiquinol 3-O-methyltransferase UbiG [Nocardia yamanashiensis]|uniref:bifunctional 2-polyprenyl-6-hydroxyphenol methylase/3-demethylubiquinol 3-O-methyltransferase UbiG n=1 Tax=Nocardia yamanashiensis TaxID=209247 RepID=UPI0008377B1C|nr:bifunctional 2-polyprenyl-6-hydroxyphenol methylase/3-demethylubiquinol 3-O-methyltransferase UbiG [Nocardia yamanashiensis]
MTGNDTDDHFFARFADTWWAEDSQMRGLASFQGPRFEFFDKHVDLWAGRRVLDVGCGGGFTTEFLDGRGASVSGVDPSPDLIAAARRHAAETGRNIEYRVGAAEALPYPDAAFDIVTCVDVLEHVADPARSIREIARVLVPGGVFCFDTINRTLRSRVVMIWIPDHLGIGTPGAHLWKDFITPGELRGYLADAGLAPAARLRGLSILGKRAGRLIMRETGDLSCTYIGVARKPE